MSSTLARLLHFSDLHLDTPFEQFTAQQSQIRRENLRQTLINICELGRKLSVDMITCAGDLYEYERIAPDTQQFLQNTFREYSDIKFLISPGNHDWFGPRSIYKNTGWSENVYIFNEPYLTPWKEIQGLTIWGGAHISDKGAKNFLENFSIKDSGINIALFHGSASIGIEDVEKARHAPFEPHQIAECGLQHALLGHFHNKTSADFYTYPGNPDPLTFGESEGRGAVLVTLHDDGRIDRVWHDVSVSVVRDVEVRLTGEATSTEVISTIRSALRSVDGFVRITLTGSIADTARIDIRQIEKISERQIQALKVRLGPVRVTLDFVELAKEKTVQGKFISNVLQDDSLNDEMKQRVIMLGIRALNGQSSNLEVLG